MIDSEIQPNCTVKKVTKGDKKQRRNMLKGKPEVRVLR
jgi:hypothetical protein